MNSKNILDGHRSSIFHPRRDKRMAAIKVLWLDASQHGYRRVITRWSYYASVIANKGVRTTNWHGFLLVGNQTNFLLNIAAGDESWVMYNNATRKVAGCRTQRKHRFNRSRIPTARKGFFASIRILAVCCTRSMSRMGGRSLRSSTLT